MQLVPALASGGVERSTLETADALVRAGHNSIVASAGGRLVASLIASGSTHIEMDLGRKSLLTLRHVLKLRRLFNKLQPDIVHARSRLPAWIAWLAMAGMGGNRPHFITSVHGLNSPGRYSRILTRGERVICVSPTVRAHVLEHWPATPLNAIRVIEPGIDSAVFNAGQGGRDLTDNTSKSRVLLMPGRGTRLKGHSAAIVLLAGLRERGMDARLRLLGTREPGREAYVAALEAHAASLGVAAHVAIEAPVQAIADAYREADLVLQLSSRPEAFGRTVVEALAVGRPVVGWAHGGVGDLLACHFPEGQVPVGDEAALLDTTLRLLGNPDAWRTRLPIHPNTLADTQRKTLDVYESVLS